MRALLVVNPRATTTTVRSRDVLVRALRSAVDLTVQHTQRRGHATTLAREAAESGIDLVVTLGGDGTLLWTSHLVGPETPMVAINSAPVTSVGYFCAGTGADVASILQQALAGQLRRTRLNRMQVEIDKKVVSKRILNDVLFCHECPAAASRYVLRHGRRSEEQLSSGLWVGPAAGSTAAQRSAGGRVLAPGSRKIQYVVREPYHGLGEPTRLARGLVSPNEALVVKSKIREGMLYMDGHNKTVSVDIGQEVRLTSSNEPLFLLGLRR